MCLWFPVKESNKCLDPMEEEKSVICVQTYSELVQSKNKVNKSVSNGNCKKWVKILRIPHIICFGAFRVPVTGLEKRCFRLHSKDAKYSQSNNPSNTLDKNASVPLDRNHTEVDMWTFFAYFHATTYVPEFRTKINKCRRTCAAHLYDFPE
jgi:hypothetical protein